MPPSPRWNLFQKFIRFGSATRPLPTLILLPQVFDFWVTANIDDLSIDI